MASNSNYFKGIVGESKTARFVILILAGIIVYMYTINAMNSYRKSQLPERIMAVSNGEVITLKRIDIDFSEIRAEAKNHLEMYIKYVYANEPRTYEENIKKSLNLCTNEVGFAIKDEQQNNDVLGKMIKNNARSVIKLDSVVYDGDHELAGHVVFSQSIITTDESSDIVQKYQKTFNFKISRTGLTRTDDNPHAMLITYFNLINLIKIDE